MFVITRVTKAAYKKALRTGSIDDVAAGLDAVIDVDLEIERGQTALHDSVQRGRAEVVRLLLNRNAKVNVCDSAKRTPLDIALGGGQSDIVDALRASGAKTFGDLVKERVELIRDQDWAKGFGWRTLRALAEDGILDEDAFLDYERFHMHSMSVWEEVGKRQRERKLHKGLIHPDEPLDPEDVRKLIATGGLLFRGNAALWSLGTRLAPDGHFLCMRRGVVYFEKLESSYETDTALGILHCREMSKTNHWYGVRRRIDYREWRDDEELTRDIFGLCLEDLESLALAYQRGFRYAYHDKFASYSCRVTCSDKDNSCDISEYYIPANVPFLAFGDTTYFLGHVSVAAFYGSLCLLTDHFNDRCDATKILLSSGLPPTLLPICQQLVINGEAHVTMAQIREIEIERRPRYF